MTTTKCELCTLREQGETDRANKTTGVQMQRLILAAIKSGGADVSRGDLMAEVGNCLECALTLITQLVWYNAQAVYIIKGGDWDAARQGFELSLMEDENDLPPDEG
ncbi:hypothetical protein [Mycolicibacterium sp. lyk4-40-TYG-92]|uniref:hypothetical protein n=1 Tax=Mycolicibacterium sp. lyk4-40-TYG-92 TaxID=3040295 RepID=UPI002549F73A|nr:hypothetical protein [Mycolicibacterium sp. lyk4-40-TYG-92]